MPLLTPLDVSSFGGCIFAFLVYVTACGGSRVREKKNSEKKREKEVEEAGSQRERETGKRRWQEKGSEESGVRERLG